MSPILFSPLDEGLKLLDALENLLLLDGKVARIWAEEWSKEGWQIDWQKLLPHRGFEALPRRWVVERTLSWLSQNQRMSKDYERLCSTSESFVYAAMSWLMVKRLASV